MPLRDVDWTSGAHDQGAFLTHWADAVAKGLNAALPADARAEVVSRTRLATTAAAEAGQAPSPPHATVPARFADQFGVTVIDKRTGGPLAAVLFVGTDHKADSDGGLVFAVRVAALVSAGVGVVVIDVTPGPPAWATHLHTLVPVYPIARRPRGPGASVFVCHPRSRGGVEQYDVWYHAVAVGGVFPSVPLPVRGDTPQVVDLEATYSQACASARLP